jgi:hypothetical protein
VLRIDGRFDTASVEEGLSRQAGFGLGASQRLMWVFAVSRVKPQFRFRQIQATRP